MKIKKLFVKNFKCIDSEGHIFDLEESHTMLVGPNGYGKTTFFEAVEVLFTGKCHRLEKNDGVTNHTQDYNRSPYLHEDGESEIFAETEDKGGGIWYYYRKFVPDDPIEGRVNKSSNYYAKKGYRILKRESDDFENLINQGLKVFISEAKEFDAVERYHLFNFLQQEENLFFLKKSEKERKDLIDELFGEELEIYDKKHNNLKSLKKTINRYHNELKDEFKKVDDEKKELEKSLTSVIENKHEFSYSKLFRNKEFSFDQNFDELTELLSKEEFQDFHDELDRLIQCKQTFSIAEYKKQQQLQKLERLESDDFRLVKYFTLKNYLPTVNYSKNKEVHQLLLPQEQAIYRFLLQDIDLDKFEEKVSYFESVNKYLNLSSLEDLYEEHSPFKTLIPNIDELKSIYSNYIQTKKQLSNGEKLVAKALKSRAELYDFETRRKFEHQSKCFYCGHEHSSPEEYYAHIEEMGEYIESSVLAFNKQFNIEQNKLQNIFKVLKDKLRIELEKKVNKIYTKEILQELRSIFENLTPVVLEKYIERGTWEWQDIETRNDLLKVLRVKTLEIKNQLRNVKEYNPQLIKICKDIEGLELESKNYGIEFDSYNPNQVKQYEVVLRGNQELLKNEKDKYTYDSSKITPEYVEIFRRYFDNDVAKYGLISEANIHQKKEYLKHIERSHVRRKVFELGKQMKVYEHQIQFIIDREKEIVTQVGMIKNAKDQFKKDVWAQIEIPLNVLTAKLLKNHYQGKGVFMDESKFVSEKDAVTDGKVQSHDIIHTFSTGQLAVVSLAFHLVIKKLFSKEREVNFLCIDDPVQDLDVMNIHNLIELIRREIMDNNSQIIISTHNDDTAMYMSYKFGKAGHNVKILNMQKEMMK